MKTTIDIDDELLRQAKNLGKMTGRPLRSVVEEGLRYVLQANSRRPRYRLPDLSVGSESRPDPLEKYSWQELRDIIYGDDDDQRLLDLPVRVNYSCRFSGSSFSFSSPVR